MNPRRAQQSIIGDKTTSKKHFFLPYPHLLAVLGPGRMIFTISVDSWRKAQKGLF
jgi:hypothetical protein